MIPFLVYLLLTQLPDSNSAIRGDSSYFLGTSAGAGVIRVADPQNAQLYGRASIPNLKIGYHLKSNIALTLQFPGGIHQASGDHRTFEATLPGLQIWPTKRLWLSAGAGLSMDKPPLYQGYQGGSENDYRGLALGMGLGYELIQQKSYSIDVQINSLYGRNNIDDQRRINFATDVVAGVNWYF